jgi:hypothetical protein
MVLLIREALALLVRPPCFLFVVLLLTVIIDFGLLRDFAIRSVLTGLIVRPTHCFGLFVEEVTVLIGVLILLTAGDLFLELTILLDFAFGCFVTTVWVVLLEELLLLTTAELFLELIVRFGFAFGCFATTVRVVLREELFLLTVGDLFPELLVPLDFAFGCFATTVRLGVCLRFTCERLVAD